MPSLRQNIVQLAKERGSDNESSIVNDDRLLPRLEAGTLRNHHALLHAWDEYVRIPEFQVWLSLIGDAIVNEELIKGKRPSPYDLRDLKDYMRRRAYAVEGTKAYLQAWRLSGTTGKTSQERGSEYTLKFQVTSSSL